MRNPDDYAPLMTDTERILSRPGPHKIMKNKPSPKGHVPEEKLARYRHLRDMSKHLETAADMMGAEFADMANSAYELAGYFMVMAQELRKDIE